MRILHTADWHLGKSVFGVSMLEDQAYLLDQLLNLVRDLKPQYLVVTGDLFDRPSPSSEAVMLLEQTISRSIIELGCSIIFIKPSIYDQTAELPQRNLVGKNDLVVGVANRQQGLVFAGNGFGQRNHRAHVVEADEHIARAIAVDDGCPHDESDRVG